MHALLKKLYNRNVYRKNYKDEVISYVHRKKIFIGLNIVITAVVLALGFSLHARLMHKDPEVNAFQQAEANSIQYPFLAKRLFLEEPNDPKINFAPLRQQIGPYFTNNGVRGSLYFEYLPTGTSVRYNGDKEYRGASLFKIPVAMELYKAAELGKVNLDQKVKIKEEHLDSNFGELYKKGAGYELTLREATKIMLSDSDNTALFTVAGNIEGKLEQKDNVFNSLDVSATTVSDQGMDIGSRSYSSFLKCLYFSCYNTKNDSQEMLKYLTETKYETRLAAGVDDKNVKVAHKIGVFNTQIQSDCGIIYLLKKNYVLCIMLEGQDDKTTNDHIAELSRLVYRYVNNDAN